MHGANMSCATQGLLLEAHSNCCEVGKPIESMLLVNRLREEMIVSFGIAKQIFDLLINHLNQQPGCAPASAEAVTSLLVALPFIESVENVRNVGALYHGPKAFSNERWTFWKDRFNVVRSRDDLREQTRSSWNS
jgi:hypothetical protein